MNNPPKYPYLGFQFYDRMEELGRTIDEGTFGKLEQQELADLHEQESRDRRLREKYLEECNKKYPKTENATCSKSSFERREKLKSMGMETKTGYKEVKSE